jgi:N6-L-threonylcarbamoyladenine synthase
MKTNKSLFILGIETSCDDTAVAVLKACNDRLEVLSSIVSSQTKIHAKWGGVVPNLAAREHLKNIIPVLNLGLKTARISPDEIGLITMTQGPGLIPALLVGTNAAKTLSYVWQKPLLGIHHIEGHIYANFIHPFKFPRSGTAPSGSNRVKFPILCLVVSGGHTQLILMNKHLDYKIVGQTLDDAAGEAFDKVARILDLGYPGGPIIASEAKKLKAKSYKLQAKLPRPMINKNNLDFSFSGLKTAVLYETKKNPKLLKNKNYIAAMCAEFQQAAIDVLISKTLKAAKIYKPKTIMLAGGVSANQELRKQLGKAIKKNLPFTSYQLPVTDYSIDNAAMIAAAGYFRWNKMSLSQKNKSLNNWEILQPDANLKLL